MFRFLNRSTADYNRFQKELLEASSLVDNTPRVELITGTKELFDSHIISFLDTAASVQILHKHVSLPWFLYLHDDEILPRSAILSKPPVLPDLPWSLPILS